MFILESGSSGEPTIVFLHGHGANGNMWKTHMAQLTEFHCLAPDFPGVGQSSAQEWTSLRATADELIKVVQECASGSRVHIVGLSLGGSVALTWLNTAPESVEHAIVDGAGVQPLPGLRLINVGFLPLQPFMHSDFIIRAIDSRMKIPPEDYKEFRQGMLTMSPSSFRHSFPQANSLRLSPGIQEVTNRMLFVSGEREPLSVKQSQASLAMLLPNANSYIAPGMGHGGVAQAPVPHCRMVKAWIRNEAMLKELDRVG